YDLTGGEGRVAGPGGTASAGANAALRGFRRLLSASKGWINDAIGDRFDEAATAEGFSTREALEGRLKTGLPYIPPRQHSPPDRRDPPPPPPDRRHPPVGQDPPDDGSVPAAGAPTGDDPAEGSRGTAIASPV